LVRQVACPVSPGCSVVVTWDQSVMVMGVKGMCMGRV
jgi:hypothetical protein